ncbi:MAG: RNA-binding protein [Chloroflexi bacterium]|nr:RNA-binding protein [Chloroflexota bacterium]
MNKKLYVGSLSYDTTDDGLRELFSGQGTVLSAEVIRDRYTGRSKGFGFVEMETVEGAEKAISAFNGTSLDDREITVAEARPPRERTERSGGYDRRGGGGGGGGGRRDRW